MGKLEKPSDLGSEDFVGSTPTGGTKMRNDIQEAIGEIRIWVAENRTKMWICSQFGCKPSTLNSYLLKNNIEYIGNQGARGYKKCPSKTNSYKYLGTDRFINSSKLRKKLIDDGIKKDECEYCGNSEWMGQKIPLDLHHIDGNRFNNSLSNLQILCKNCHGLTENHSRIKK